MKNKGLILGAAGLAVAGLVAAVPALADAAPALIKAPTAAQQAAMSNKGDTAWMLTSSALVLMMSVPGLALFYGGLVRTKNMLSVLMQVLMIVSITTVVWCCWGYSEAFSSGTAQWGATLGQFFGGTSKLFLAGVNASTYAGTFSNNVYIPEYAYVCFQMTFACITPALIIGGFAERVKFTPLMIFMVLWLTFAYFPIAHMVWYWAGPDFLPDAPKEGGFLFNAGALDFAGGTVVHINAGIAALMGCLVIGKRTGFKSEPMPPHSLTMTMIGASLLWVGWFGFNAGSNLEANGVTSTAFINTFVATAAAAVSWALVEQIIHGKPSLLGAASGAVAGLVAITPASGFAAPMTSIVLGLVVSPICFFFCTTVKNMLKYDDSLDVFGVHCIGGIVGALGTAIVADPKLGGQGYVDYTKFPGVSVTPAGYSILAQLQTQLEAIGITLLWSGGVALLLFLALKYTIGIRPSVEAEQEGLDISSHGERAYNY